MKVQVEGMARAESGDNSLTQKAIEEVLLRFITEDEDEEKVNMIEGEETEETINWVKNKNHWRQTRGNFRGRGRGNQRRFQGQAPRGRGGDRKCYTCDQEGHISRYCPIKQKILESQKNEAAFTGMITNETSKMNSSNQTDESIFARHKETEEDETEAKRD